MQKLLRFCFPLEKYNFILRVFVFYGFWCDYAIGLLKGKVFQNTKKEFIAIFKININLGF